MSSRIRASLYAAVLILAAPLAAQDAAVSARALFEKGDFRGAAYFFERAEDRGETGPADRAMYAIALSELGRHEDAAALIERVLEESAGQGFAHYAAGIASFNAGDFKTAVVRFEEAMEIEPSREAYRRGRGVAYVNIGISEYGSGDIEGAERSFTRALETDPLSVPALRNLGVLLSESARPDEAVTLYRRALEIEPGNGEIHALLAAALGEAGDVNGLTDALERWTAADPLNGEAWAWAGSAYRDAGNDDASLGAFRNAVRLGTEEPAPYLEIAQRDEDVNMVHLAIGKAIQKAGALELMVMQGLESEGGTIDEAALERAASFAEALSVPRRQLSEALTLLAGLRSGGDFVSDVMMLMEWYPHSIDLRAALAAHYLGAGKAAEAADLWRSVLTDSPGYVEGHLGLGASLEASGEYAAAAVSYRRALGLDPDNRGVYSALRNVYRITGKGRELREILSERTIIDTWNAVLLEELIELEKELGMGDSAASRMERLEKIRETE